MTVEKNNQTTPQTKISQQIVNKYWDMFFWREIPNVHTRKHLFLPQKIASTIDHLSASKTTRSPDRSVGLLRVAMWRWWKWMDGDHRGPGGFGISTFFGVELGWVFIYQGYWWPGRARGTRDFLGRKKKLKHTPKKLKHRMIIEYVCPFFPFCCHMALTHIFWIFIKLLISSLFY